jgi:hypothetical protein
MSWGLRIFEKDLESLGYGTPNDLERRHPEG